MRQVYSCHYKSSSTCLAGPYLRIFSSYPLSFHIALTSLLYSLTLGRLKHIRLKEHNVSNKNLFSRVLYMLVLKF